MKAFARRRVLVVDDNAHARAFLAQILGAVDVEVIQAETGGQALVILKSTRVDAVISDMFMRPMDGVELTLAIRAFGKAEVANLPVIMASAQANKKVVSDARAAGVSGFLAKPFSPKAVLTRLEAALWPLPAAEPLPPLGDRAYI